MKAKNNYLVFLILVSKKGRRKNIFEKDYFNSRCLKTDTYQDRLYPLSHMVRSNQ